MFFADLTLGVCLLAAVIAVYRHRKEKNVANRRVTVDISNEDYEVLAAWAERHGENVKTYAKRTLLESFPALESAKLVEERERTALEKAFGALDDEEERASEAGIPGILPVAPMRKPIPGVKTEAEQTHPRQRVVKHGHVSLPSVPPGVHPCMHLSASVPSHLQGQCQGICEHREQRGRPCYWAPTTANECNYFEPIMRRQ